MPITDFCHLLLSLDSPLPLLAPLLGLVTHLAGGHRPSSQLLHSLQAATAVLVHFPSKPGRSVPSDALEANCVPRLSSSTPVPAAPPALEDQSQSPLLGRQLFSLLAVLLAQSLT